jgi:RimJ/RimL family protein N-acetyltransferase
VGEYDPTRIIAALDYQDYAAAETRRSLFRVLARSIVRELKTAGHDGSDLIGFVSEVMKAVTDTGFEREPRSPEPSAEPLEGLVRDSRGRPSFVGEGLTLRPVREGDRVLVQSWAEDPVVGASLAPSLIAGILDSLEGEPAAGRLDLLLCEPATDRPFGAVSLQRIDPATRQAEIAKVIGVSAYRGRGLARHATLRLLQYGFRVLDLNRVYLRTLGGNLANIRLNERMGFRFEGVLKQAHIRDGQLSDVVLMALLRSEFFERQGGGDSTAGGPAPGSEDRADAPVENGQQETPQ